MRKSASIILGVSTAALLLGSLFTSPTVMAQGSAPADKVCKDKANPPKDSVTQGGCVAIDRKKGNCFACHQVNGKASGNVAPPLVSMKARFPDKNKLRAQVWDATVINKDSVMPPFGRHGILKEDEIDKVVEWLLTL